MIPLCCAPLHSDTVRSGLEHFNELTNFGQGGLGVAFGEILSWTLMWSFFATFSNYFLGDRKSVV